MSNAQKFLVYSHIGQLAGMARVKYSLSLSAAFQKLREVGALEKISDLKTGYYLESDAYLYNEFFGE
jgi:hypothetical protein